MVLSKEVIDSDFKRSFLNFIQREFPLDKRPFLRIAERFNIKERDVIEIIKKFQEDNIIRQISAIFNPQFFGHKSGLFAFRVPEERLEEVVEIINRHPGVSHNYLRNHFYNIWFILVVLPEKDLLEEVRKLAERCRISDYLYLPALRIFKISTVLNLEDNRSVVEEQEEVFSFQQKRDFKFSEFDKKVVKALQEPLNLKEEPFKEIAELLNTSEDRLIEWIKSMKKKGALRRFGALLKHDRVGYRINVMVAWRVESNRIQEVVERLVKEPFITHCYERKTYPNWRYNLYTMCHFKEKKEKEIIPVLAEECKIEDFLMLETIKELKKIRLKLFYN